MLPESVLQKIEMAKNATSDIPENMRGIYLQLIDNQVKEFERIQEQTTQSNIDRVATVFLPTIKKLARDSIIPEIVGVQPIKDRVALVKYVDYVYSSTDATSGANAGDSVYGDPTTEYSRDPGEGMNISRGIDLVIREKEVKSRQRKLAARWTFEAQDSADQEGYNIEQEITKTLAAKIVEEINFEVIGDLYASASGASTTWAAPAAADSPTTKDRKEKELYYAILDVAAEIYNKTRRTPNWCICSPKTAAILKRTGDYVAINSAGPGMPTGIKRFFQLGTMSDEFNVFVVPNLNTHNILIGYKGNSELESGYIYAPYRQLIVMDSFYNVENWSWIKSVGSSYCKASVMPDCYGIVNVTFS